jgi:hypothetical protein
MRALLAEASVRRQAKPVLMRATDFERFVGYIWILLGRSNSAQIQE